MIIPVKSGYQFLTRWRPLLIHPSVRTMITGRSGSETPQAVPDGSFVEIVFLSQSSPVGILDWGVVKPQDKQPVSTPIKRDEKHVGVPEEAKEKEIEILWPTDTEIQQGEYTKPQWERKQVNVGARIFGNSNLIALALLAYLVRL